LQDGWCELALAVEKLFVFSVELFFGKPHLVVILSAERAEVLLSNGIARHAAKGFLKAEISKLGLCIGEQGEQQEG